MHISSQTANLHKKVYDFNNSYPKATGQIFFVSYSITFMKLY